MTNRRKPSNLVKSHELICHFIRLYLVPLPPQALDQSLPRYCLNNLRRHIFLLHFQHQIDQGDWKSRGLLCCDRRFSWLLLCIKSNQKPHICLQGCSPRHFFVTWQLSIFSKTTIFRNIFEQKTQINLFVFNFAQVSYILGCFFIYS